MAESGFLLIKSSILVSNLRSVSYALPLMHLLFLKNGWVYPLSIAQLDHILVEFSSFGVAQIVLQKVPRGRCPSLRGCHWPIELAKPPHWVRMVGLPLHRGIPSTKSIELSHRN